MPSPVHPYSDYGVALRTLRSARGWLGFAMLTCVVFQFVGFALMYWTPQPYTSMHAQRTLIGPTSAPSEDHLYPGTEQSRRLNIRNQWDATYTMFVPVTQLIVLISVTSQTIILFLTLLVVLVAQAPGVTQLTKSLIWSVLLLFMFLPLKYFAKDFPIPGVIYSYSELLGMVGPIVAPDPEHMASRWQVLLLHVRFVGWPLIGLLVLLITSERYRAGIMLAIGHPLQSMLQARPIGPLPIASPEKRIP